MNRLAAWLQGVRPILFPRSLRYQLLSRILLILAGLLLVLGLSQYVFLERFLYQNRAAAVQRQVLSVPGDIWERLTSSNRRGPAEAFVFFPSSSVAYLNKQGRFAVLTTNGAEAESAVPRLSDEDYGNAAKRTRRDKPLYRVVNGASGEQLVVLQAVRSFQGTGGVVQIATGTAPLKSELYRQLRLYLALAFAALVCALLVFLPAIRRTLTPLSRMVETVERIDSGKLSERLPEPAGPMEIDRLSHSFNRMLERLERSFRAEQESRERMRRFVSDASHELRTPLTSIHGFLEVLLRGAAADPDQLGKALRSMHGESERINKLVGDLLLLAKADRAFDARLEPTQLGPILSEMEPQFKLLAGERQVRFDLRETEELPLDADKVKQIALNLFQNAIQHTDAASGVIAVSVRPHPRGAELTVADNGPGIAPEHLPRLFERFYRIDDSRARKLGGAGLGLSISRSLAEVHGGSIRAESRLDEGSEFIVFFPHGRRETDPADGGRTGGTPPEAGSED
ncbi:sensor histidine kinase [Cohnella cellulosilytica]|uniref:histidine kinase n=1 Tax=Cohnella cellulosilytica TaxID=986710 RepID=A0ABW2F523_9BACL